jgi:hypothetical protein
MRRIQNSMASLGLTLLLAGAAEAALRTRVSTDPTGTAYVGQYVSVSVDLLSPGQFAGAPTFDLPEVEGGVILQLGSQGTHGSEQIDGQSWHVVNYSFALFPQRPGTCSVPPIGLRFAADSGIQPLRTEAVRIEAIMPEGAEGLTVLVSTPALKVEEGWSPDAGDLKVGDAMTRMITMTAESVLGMGLPPLPFPEVDGLGMYPQDPAVEDNIHRGDFTGMRIESATYVCERPGEYELPAIRIPWFDLSAKKLKQVELPGRVITVAPNPELEAVAGPPGRGAGRGGFPGFPLLAVVLVTVAAACGWQFRSRLKKAYEAWRRRRQESEAAYFERFVRAAGTESPGAALEALLRWLDRSGIAGEPATVSGFSARASDSELTELLGKLTDAMYVRGDGAWSDGARLAGAVKRARRAILHQKRSATSRNPHRLAPLNLDGWPGGPTVGVSDPNLSVRT